MVKLFFMIRTNIDHKRNEPFLHKNECRQGFPKSQLSSFGRGVIPENFQQFLHPITDKCSPLRISNQLRK